MHSATPKYSPSSCVSQSTPEQLEATWLCCALGRPPSSRPLKKTIGSMLASRLGRQLPPQWQPQSDGVRVLSLDGGGTRALLTIEMLKELERHTGKRVHELFDVIAGTSTGGILAAGIQEGLSLEELESLYMELAGLVFAKEPGPRPIRLLLTGAAYKAHKLEAILQRVFPR